MLIRCTKLNAPVVDSSSTRIVDCSESWAVRFVPQSILISTLQGHRFPQIFLSLKCDLIIQVPYLLICTSLKRVIIEGINIGILSSSSLRNQVFSVVFFIVKYRFYTIAFAVLLGLV